MKTKGQRYQTARGHPLAPPSGLVSVARLVLYEKIGPGEHRCHWCGDPVHWVLGGPGTPNALFADHLDHDRHNDAPENLVPSCNSCNAHRTRAGDRRRLADDDLTVMWSGRLTRAVRKTCETCGDAFLTIPAEIKKGKGRFCTPSCARKAPRKDRTH